MVKILIGIGVVLLLLGLLISVLAYIGARVMEQDKKTMEQNRKNIDRFLKIQKYKRYAQKSTPRVPTNNNTK